MARKYDPISGMLVDDQGIEPPMSPYKIGQPNPYQRFRSEFSPTGGSEASDLSSNLMGGYKKVSYNPQTAQDYIPQNVLSQLGQVTGSLANYTPEKINVGKTQSMPVEYYQSQLDDLSKPLTEQYNLARANMRGDQAARGVLYDSEGSNEIINKLDKPYMEQLGSALRGVQQQRMQNEYQADQTYQNNLLNEALNRRSTGLQGLTAGGNLAQGVAGMYGQLGSDESQRMITTALQNKGLDANAINSLLGYGADVYGTQGNLFGDIYGQDTSYATELMEDARARDESRRQNIIDLLNMQGYTEVPQSDLWGALSTELNYKPTEIQGQYTPGAPPPEAPPEWWTKPPDWYNRGY